MHSIYACMHARMHAYKSACTHNTHACVHSPIICIICMHAYYACMHAMHECMHACYSTRDVALPFFRRQGPRSILFRHFSSPTQTPAAENWLFSFFAEIWGQTHIENLIDLKPESVRLGRDWIPRGRIPKGNSMVIVKIAENLDFDVSGTLKKLDFDVSGSKRAR